MHMCVAYTCVRPCDQVYRIKDEIEVKGMQYPPYYLQPFHAYDEGNLNW